MQRWSNGARTIRDPPGRGFYPTLLGEPAQDYPAVEPHIVLSKVWNALAEKAEPGAAPVSAG
jgi:hypothetical protein